MQNHPDVQPDLFSATANTIASQPVATAPVVKAQIAEVLSPTDDAHVQPITHANEHTATKISPFSQQVLGAVLGAAIGDAMGHPTEFLSMESIHSRFGALGVQNFELYWQGPKGRFAPYTDDTQMAEIVLRTLIDGNERDLDLDATMSLMAKDFIQWASHPQGGHRAPGNACLSGCRALANGAPWFEAGGATAGGCGSVMRAYPFGLLFVNDLAKAESWAVAHSKLTHRDPIALAASAAMAVGMALAMRHASVQHICNEMIQAAARYCANTASMVRLAFEDARNGVPPSKTLDRLRAWAAHEAIAAAVYIFARHPNDARAAILEGANTPGDSDSIATLAGALVGARVGVEGLPEHWVKEVERTEELRALALRIKLG
jgi:ADP-ribosylglycohydrolase